MRHARWVPLAAACLLGCTPAPEAGSFSLGLDRTAEPVTPVAVGAQSPSPSGAGGPTVVPPTPTPASPSPSPSPVRWGGGSAPAPSTPTPSVLPDSYLLLADGRIVAVPEGDAVDLPVGTRGEVSLMMRGRVPSTIQLDGPDPLPVLHPRGATAPAAPGTTADVSGALATPERDVSVSYLSPGRAVSPGATTDVWGVFAFSVPVGAAEDGLILAKDAGSPPRLAAARLAIAPDQNIGAPALALAAPTGTDTAPTDLPAGMSLKSAALRVATGDAGAGPVTILSVGTAQALPLYDLAGLTVTVRYDAATADGASGASVTGPSGHLPAFLTAPDLSALPATLTLGQRLSWPAVAGASLYSVWLCDAGSPDEPLWEAACTTPAVTVPTAVAIAGRTLLFEVTAWDAPDVLPYSVAAARQLRVPTELSGPSGRSSRTTWRFSP